MPTAEDDDDRANVVMMERLDGCNCDLVVTLGPSIPRYGTSSRDVDVDHAEDCLLRICRRLLKRQGDIYKASLS